MRSVKTIIILILSSSIVFQTTGQQDEVEFFKTVRKKRLHYIEFNNGIAIVYQMGKYFDHVGKGSAILKVDTLVKISQSDYVGKYYALKQEKYDGLVLTSQKRKLEIEKVTDVNSVYINLNNAYYLKSQFELSDRLNKKYPLYHYTFRNGYYGWEKLENKTQEHNEFKQKTNAEINSIYDSIGTQQDKYTNTTNFILTNLISLPYATIKDSLTTLPIEYRSSSYYFGTVVNETAKQKPEYFFRIAEDFPAGKSIIFSAVQYDKNLFRNLQQVDGHERIKAEFFSYHRSEKAMIYKIMGTYVILGGLLTWLIVSQ